MKEMQDHLGVNKLCEAVGVNPSAYVRFRRPRLAAQESPSSPNSPIMRERAEKHENSTRGIRPHRFPTITPERTSEDSQDVLNATLAVMAKNKLTATSVPVQIALLSNAAGVGKTAIAGILSVMLANRGYSILLADYSKRNDIHSLFEIQDDLYKPVSFALSSEQAPPLSILSLFRNGWRRENFQSWFQFIAHNAQFVFHDSLVGTMQEARSLLANGAVVIVPVLPDAMSIQAAMRMHATLARIPNGEVWYLLNRFDVNQPAHREARERLRGSLGERLLPFEISNLSLMSKGSAGNLLDESTAANFMVQPDLGALADWVELYCLSSEASGE